MRASRQVGALGILLGILPYVYRHQLICQEISMKPQREPIWQSKPFLGSAANIFPGLLQATILPME
jgi:hypothetical protein